MRANDLIAFIKEREAIRIAKEAGKPRPWTSDPILNTYRFCNVRRNDDRVSRWIHQNMLFDTPWSDPLVEQPDLWFAMVVARLFNNEQTLEALVTCRDILPFRPDVMRKRLQNRAKAGHKNFNAAYIVSTNGRAMDKVEYVVDVILKPLWKDRARLRPTINDTLDSWHQLLCSYQGLGSFMAAQVVADMKYVEPLRSASDWAWWAASGPGSKRGLNRVMGRHCDAPYPEARWREDFHDLWNVVNGKLKWKEPITGQDLQNCLCEFDKYERARTGEGRPKQIYKEK